MTSPRTFREFALSLLERGDVASKLSPPPDDLVDEERGAPLRLDAPVRDPELAIVAGRRAPVPPLSGWADPAQRARILHAWANHELQAAELFAWGLLAFPDADPQFRRGLLRIAAEEQRHAVLYIERLEALGAAFGDHPVSGHFWRDLDGLRTPLDFVCRMGLVLENANLDFARDQLRVSREAGDVETAEALEIVHADEVGHVAFAWTWFRRLKDPARDDWSVFVESIGGEHRAGRARGREFDRAARFAAGLDADFVARLEAELPTAPGGRPR
ncbi:MAG: DUF455 family protein [Planctomycetota bacterium]